MLVKYWININSHLVRLNHHSAGWLSTAQAIFGKLHVWMMHYIHQGQTLAIGLNLKPQHSSGSNSFSTSGYQSSQLAKKTNKREQLNLFNSIAYVSILIIYLDVSDNIQHVISFAFVILNFTLKCCVMWPL